MQELFNSSNGLQLSLSQVAEEVVRFMKAEPERKYKVTIGTDSLRLSTGMADFVTAVVVHRVGHGGRYFWRRQELGKFHNLRDRIIKEVLISIDAAKEVLLQLKKYSSTDSFLQQDAIPGDVPLFPHWDFEVHIDVGENGPTKQMIQEVVGMVRAYNFEPVTKPMSYAASNVADRHVG